MGYQLPLMLLALTGSLAGALAGATAEQGSVKDAVQALQDRRMLVGDVKFSHKELAAHRRRLAAAGVTGPQLARLFLGYLKNSVPAYSNYAKVMERTGTRQGMKVAYYLRGHCHRGRGEGALRRSQLVASRPFQVQQSRYP